MQLPPKSSPSSARFQSKASPIISISPSALTQIRDLSLASREVESGGILVGNNIGRDIHIISASGPGPNAQQSGSHFLRDTNYCREFLSRSYVESGADYVGEWHSHVIDLRQLSGGDLGTLAGIFIDPDYEFLTFAMVLVVEGAGEPELHVYSAERLEGTSRRRRIAITELYSGIFPDGGRRHRC